MATYHIPKRGTFCEKCYTPEEEKPKKRKAASGAGARKKGHNFERQIANELGHIFPEAKRQLEYQTSDCMGTDITGTERLQIQTKFRQNYVPVGTIREVRLRDKDGIPLLITKGNNQEPMAILPWKDMLKFIEIAYGVEPRFRSMEQAHYGEIADIVLHPSLMIEEKTRELDLPADCAMIDPTMLDGEPLHAGRELQTIMEAEISEVARTQELVLIDSFI